MGDFFTRKKNEDVSSQAKESKHTKAPAKKKKPQVRVARATFARVLTNKLFRAIGWAFVFVAVVYLSFVITIMRVVPTTSAGLVPVKNITFEGGLVPAGEEVLVNITQKQGTGIVDYLKQAFLPMNDAAVVRVEAGPWGNYNWAEPGIVSVKGQILEMSMEMKPEDTTLADSYLVTCIEGACVPGEGFVIPKNHIVGQPLVLTSSSSDELVEEVE